MKKMLNLMLLFILTRQCRSAPEFGFRFVEWPSWGIVGPDQEIHLKCSTNLKVETIQWRFNHQHLLSDNFIKIKPHGKRSSSLILKVPTQPQLWNIYQGIYQCVASVGSISVVSLPGQIQVAYLHPFEEADRDPIVSSIEVSHGDSVTVPCTRPSSLPEAQLSFYKNGNILHWKNTTNYFVTEFGDLIIVRTSSETQGLYACSAKNEVLNRTQLNPMSTRILLESSPTHTSSRPFNDLYKSTQTTTKGGTVYLLCLTHGQHNATIQWYEQTTLLHYQTAIIHINPPQTTTYQCVTEGPEGILTANITVAVQEIAALIESTGSTSVREGQQTSLSCLFHGSPPPTVAWVFNGHFLVHGDNVDVDGGKMTIRNINRNQAGIYQCFAFNPLGAASQTAMIGVVPNTVTAATHSDSEDGLPANRTQTAFTDKYKKRKKSKYSERKRDRRKWKTSRKDPLFSPSRPVIHKLTEESVLVTWNMSAFTEPPVLFFKVQFKDMVSRPQKKRLWRTVDENILPEVRSFEVTGLQAQHEYRFRIASVYMNNDHKLGGSSAKFFLKKTIRLKKPPNAPVITDVAKLDRKRIHIFWSYQIIVKTEGFIVSYQDASSAAQYIKVTLLGDSRRSFILDSIKNQTIYDFKVCSFNLAGTSRSSPIRTYVPADMRRTAQESEAAMVVPVVRSSSNKFSNKYLFYLLIGGVSGVVILVAASIVCYIGQTTFKRQSPRNPEKACDCSFQTIPRDKHCPMLEIKDSLLLPPPVQSSATSSLLDHNKNKQTINSTGPNEPPEYDRFICRLNK